MMRVTSPGLLVTVAITLLSSCSPQQTVTSDVIESATATAPDVSQDVSHDNSFASVPGQYCYLLNNGLLATYLRLTLDNENQVTGDARSSVQNEDATYSTSYVQSFSGVLAKEQAVIDLTTWIEADVETTRTTWTLTNDTLQTNNSILNLTDCEAVDAAFQDHNGLEAKDLLDGANNITTQQVEFESDRRYTTMSNSVVRGDRNVYILDATGGQQMSLTIQASEDSATFDVISPSGYILAFSAVDETIPLPHTGEYKVVVAGTRGNAAYDLFMSVQ
ncbi:MAG: hypothetical protein ACFB14_22290 [Leptolyngbyaceae cyanobacterium]